MTKIGLPKALFYYQHSAVWEGFFRNLGCEVIVSGDTNKEILDRGVRCCSNDTCLPVKVFHGHVDILKGNVDYVFIPRYTCLINREYTCPKFCGLPEMTYLNLDKQVRLLEISLNVETGHMEAAKGLKTVSKSLDLDYRAAEEAFQNALRELEQGYKKCENSFGEPVAKERDRKRQTLAVLGHPYMIYDKYLSMKLLEKLRSRNISIVTPADLEYQTKRRHAVPYQEKVFWEVGLDNLGSAFVFAGSENIDGIIYLTPFACGVDSFVIEFIERRLKSDYTVPFLKLTVDEHTGEAGFDTRLEAFLDMIG
ncbi:MAG: acyl-CoA dehydratase activase-related protein [Clostridia bacterium]|nr:acyl-CoA dehydratase activase-related protein [Clostridia bacterium]